MDPVKTGLLIKQARTAGGLTQKQLAGQLHLSDRTVSKWERGAGLPDISLLEPLADALGLTVQELLRGERSTEPDTDRAEDAVRRALRLVLAQSRQKLRQNFSRLFAGAVLVLFLGFFAFAALDTAGVFLTPVQMERSAVLYRDGIPAGETTVTIDGTLQTIYDRSFQGRFSLAEAPGSAAAQVSAFIEWDTPYPNYQSIHFSRPGLLGVDGGIGQYLYISPDMKHFAFTLADGRIVATSDGLAALQAIEAHRYALDYEALPVFGYIHHGD